MATTPQCLYCFEVLAAHFEQRPALRLKQVEDQWAQYEKGALREEAGVVEGEERDIDMEGTGDRDDDEYEQGTRPIAGTLRPREVSRLQAPSPASASSSSTPSTLSATSSQIGASSNASKASSRTSLFSLSRPSPVKQNEEEYPLFVTWNTISSRGHKSLRGCIGTFEAQELSVGLESYALAS